VKGVMKTENIKYELVYRIEGKTYRKISHDRQCLHDRWESLQKNLPSHTKKTLSYVKLGIVDRPERYTNNNG